MFQLRWILSYIFTYLLADNYLAALSISFSLFMYFICISREVFLSLRKLTTLKEGKWVSHSFRDRNILAHTCSPYKVKRPKIHFQRWLLTNQLLCACTDFLLVTKKKNFLFSRYILWAVVSIEVPLQFYLAHWSLCSLSTAPQRRHGFSFWTISLKPSYSILQICSNHFRCLSF